MPEAYEDLIAACEAQGAKMYFEKEGHQWGAWVIRLPNGNTIVAESNGNGFPLLDRLHA